MLLTEHTPRSSDLGDRLSWVLVAWIALAWCALSCLVAWLLGRWFASLKDD